MYIQGNTNSVSTRRPITIPSLKQMKKQNESIVMITSYDASFAALVGNANVDIVLVSDSLGMVIGGHASTLPVTLDEMFNC